MSSPARPPEVEPQQTLRRYFDRMLGVLGPQGWWPARTRLEIILGAILVQNTTWQNAALALKRLKQGGLLTLRDLRKSSLVELESYIRPSGFYRQKARTIRNFFAWLDRACAGSLGAMFALPSAQARQQLLQIKGLGPETVDAILLYAGRHPFFVADAYTRRILSRHGLVHPEAGYASAQQFLHQHLPADPAQFNEYHALLVEVGKRYCRPQAPRCDACPLEEFLSPARPAEIAYYAS